MYCKKCGKEMEDTFDFLTNAWFGLVGIVIVAMYIRNFRRWLYKK